MSLAGYQDNLGRPLPSSLSKPGMSYDEVLHDDFQFDIDAHDVMVFLHIQKTGGTSFGKHLVMDLDLKVYSKSAMRTGTKKVWNFVEELYANIRLG